MVWDADLAGASTRDKTAGALAACTCKPEWVSGLYLLNA